MVLDILFFSNMAQHNAAVFLNPAEPLFRPRFSPEIDSVKPFDSNNGSSNNNNNNMCHEGD